jgi:hypothetical protein
MKREVAEFHKKLFMFDKLLLPRNENYFCSMLLNKLKKRIEKDCLSFIYFLYCTDLPSFDKIPTQYQTIAGILSEKIDQLLKILSVCTQGHIRDNNGFIMSVHGIFSLKLGLEFKLMIKK